MTSLTAGMRFGKLFLRQKARSNPKLAAPMRPRWICDCDCGQRLTIPQMYLLRKLHPKIDCGLSGCRPPSLIQQFSDIYHIWTMMKWRCENPTHIGYKHYGGRGIQVCEAWRDPTEGFQRFLTHIGPRPSPQHTVDRYPNNDGNYEPGNVRWATGEQQAANKRPRISK